MSQSLFLLHTWRNVSERSPIIKAFLSGDQLATSSHLFTTVVPFRSHIQILNIVIRSTLRPLEK